MKIELDVKKILSEHKKEMPLIAICTFAIISFVVILLGIMLCKLPVVMVCTIVLLETGIAVCLHNLPLWVHGLVLLAELIAGILCGKILFIILAGVVYAVAILALHFLGVEK